MGFFFLYKLFFFPRALQIKMLMFYEFPHTVHIILQYMVKKRPIQVYYNVKGNKKKFLYALSDLF